MHKSKIEKSQPTLQQRNDEATKKYKTEKELSEACFA
jgi:hypothetical protein